MIVVLEHFDGADLGSYLPPVRIELLRQFLSAPDKHEYWLGMSEKPIPADAYPRKPVEQHHVIVSPGWVGQSLSKVGMEGRVNLAFISDKTQIGEDALDFSKSEYVAICHGRVTSGSFE